MAIVYSEKQTGTALAWRDHRHMECVAPVESAKPKPSTSKIALLMTFARLHLIACAVLSGESACAETVLINKVSRVKRVNSLRIRTKNTENLGDVRIIE